MRTTKKSIPLSAPTFGSDEICAAIETMLSTNVTMGKNVEKFEKEFASYVGAEEAIMVNSGSSANLIAMSILSNPTTPNHLRRDDEVIVPAVTWSTSIFPIINIGCIPVLVDVERDSYNMNPDLVEEAITPRTKAIVAVSLLGNPCDLLKLDKIAKRHGLFLIEDACESHGALIGKRKVGTFGFLSSFSFFFSHHISTMEGGMVLTDNEATADLARIMRAHGWIREVKSRRGISRQFPGIDERFLFLNLGFNLRPTEVQAAFGLQQIKKLEKFIEIRRFNSKYWNDRLRRYADYLMLPEEKSGTRHVFFGYPITVKPGAPFKKRDIVEFLEAKGIETRPIMAGNMAEQPALGLFEHRIAGDLAVSRSVMRNSFFIGNHHAIQEKEREYVSDSFDQFMRNV